MDRSLSCARHGVRRYRSHAKCRFIRPESSEGRARSFIFGTCKLLRVLVVKIKSRRPLSTLSDPSRPTRSRSRPTLSRSRPTGHLLHYVGSANPD